MRLALPTSQQESPGLEHHPLVTAEQKWFGSREALLICPKRDKSKWNQIWIKLDFSLVLVDRIIPTGDGYMTG